MPEEAQDYLLVIGELYMAVRRLKNVTEVQEQEIKRQAEEISTLRQLLPMEEERVG